MNPNKRVGKVSRQTAIDVPPGAGFIWVHFCRGWAEENFHQAIPRPVRERFNVEAVIASPKDNSI